MTNVTGKSTYLTDDNGNVIYPVTDSSLVFSPSTGKNIEEILQTTVNYLDNEKNEIYPDSLNLLMVLEKEIRESRKTYPKLYDRINDMDYRLSILGDSVPASSVKTLTGENVQSILENMIMRYKINENLLNYVETETKRVENALDKTGIMNLLESDPIDTLEGNSVINSIRMIERSINDDIYLSIINFDVIDINPDSVTIKYAIRSITTLTGRHTIKLNGSETNIIPNKSNDGIYTATINNLNINSDNRIDIEIIININGVEYRSTKSVNVQTSMLRSEITISNFKKLESSIDTQKISYKLSIEGQSIGKDIRHYIRVNGEKRLVRPDITPENNYLVTIDNLPVDTLSDCFLSVEYNIDDNVAISQSFFTIQTNNMYIMNFRIDELKHDSLKFSFNIINDNQRGRHSVIINGTEYIISNPEIIDGKNILTISDLTPGTKYNIMYKYLVESGGLIKEITKEMNLYTPELKVYGIRVNESESNPSTSVTYISDAQGIEPATPSSLGGWSNKFPFNKIRPCGFKNGTVVKYINPDDFSKYIDGTSVTDDVDVMIEIPKVYWKFVKNDTGYDIFISDIKVDDSYFCGAHMVGDQERDVIYIGAYMGSIIDNKLRSKSREIPSGSRKLSAFRNHAISNGERYGLINYYQYSLLQILYLLLYKNRDGQKSLGRGYVKAPGKEATGTTSDKGMVFGTQTGLDHVKFCGIEDLWGNMGQLIDGILITNEGNLLLSDGSVYNDTGENYVDHGLIVEGDAISGYLSAIKADNHKSFLPNKATGSSTTRYCDFIYVNKASQSSINIMFFGGVNDADVFAGPFHKKTIDILTYTSGYSSRLSYI